MVKIQKYLAHPLIYRLLKLVLTLRVATANLERCFSAMKLVKTAARNRIGNRFLSDCWFVLLKKKLFDLVSNEKVIKKIQMMKMNVKLFCKSCFFICWIFLFLILFNCILYFASAIIIF